MINDNVLSVTGGDLITYLNGSEGTATSVNQAWMDYLTREGYTTGTLNDRLFNKLRDDGFTGTLADMLTGFWRTPQVNYVARLDGATQYWQLSERLINPDGDIDIEFKTGSNVNGGGSDKVVLSQCLTAAYSGSSGKEFTLYFNTGGYLQALHGGNFFASSPSAPIGPNKTYRWRLVGNQQEFFVDGVLVDSNTVSRGSAREPSAQCLIGAQVSGGALRAYFDGPIYDVKVNSAIQVEIPLTNKAQGATQLATVGDVNATMVNYDESVWEVLPELWYNKITGMVICSDKLIECNEELITCL